VGADSSERRPGETIKNDGRGQRSLWEVVGGHFSASGGGKKTKTHGIRSAQLGCPLKNEKEKKTP